MGGAEREGKGWRNGRRGRGGGGADEPTAYFFAGGRARWPLVKLEAYALLELTRFSWMGVGAMVGEKRFPEAARDSSRRLRVWGGREGRNMLKASSVLYIYPALDRTDI